MPAPAPNCVLFKGPMSSHSFLGSWLPLLAANCILLWDSILLVSGKCLLQGVSNALKRTGIFELTKQDVSLFLSACT